MITRLIAIGLVLLTTTAAAQEAQKREQYKRVHQDVIHTLQAGDALRALNDLLAFQAENPADIDTWMMLGVAYAHLGEVEHALTCLETALDLGLPPGRLAAERNNLLIPLKDVPQCQTWLQEMGSQVIHGPMLGRLEPESAAFWVRLAGEGEVMVEVDESEDFASSVKSPVVPVTEETDFTAVAPVHGLKANGTYFYRLIVDGQPTEATYTFRTPAERGKPGAFSVAFGGGAGYVPMHEHMWNTVRAQDPLAFFFLGDNIYPDAPESNEVQRYSYYRRQSRPEYRGLVAGTAMYAVWDDHDFGTNDCSGGPDPANPAWKPVVWNIFKQNWVNPSYGGGEGTYGCWFKASLGDVDFFMLDSRYYRTDPETTKPADRTMLGPAQKQWLFGALAESTATFKVICSPVPVSSDTKPGSLDTWDGFDKERAELFAQLDGNKVEGVFIISADRHRSDLWRIDREGSYPLYEFESSRLTNQHVHQKMPGAIFSYNESHSFGMLDFDTTLDDPSVTYRIINVDGEQVYSHTIHLSEMKMP